MNSSDTEKIITYISDVIDLGADENKKLGKEYSYTSLPLCVIDAVFSVGIDYDHHTRPVVEKWCKEFHWRLYGHAPKESHTIDEFISTLKPYEEKNDDFQSLAKVIGLYRTSSKNGILKAKAVYEFAKILSEEGVQSFSDTRNGIKNDILIEARIKSNITGQKSGISYKYFCMLAGSENLVKADRMICRFVANALGKSTEEPKNAAKLIISASDELHKQSKFSYMNPRLMDYVIWNYQRGLKKRPRLSCL